jgi:tetratricopeptide (TPR) repeat protein
MDKSLTNIRFRTNKKENIMKLQTILFLIAILVMNTNLFAQDHMPNTPEARWSLAMHLEKELEEKKEPKKEIELAILFGVIAGTDKNDQETTIKAEKLLSKASKANPKNYTLMATHGSVLTMLARYEKNQGKQLRYVKLGTRKLDRAVKRDPDNIGVLQQRANNSLNLPPFLNRTHFAEKDFQKILTLIGDKRGPEFKAMIQFNLGRTYEINQNSNKAKEYWQKAVNLNVPYWSEKAQKQLNQ